jgi:GrpB-like predicted nucleotidyltransferase (UPF0157 family)
MRGYRPRTARSRAARRRWYSRRAPAPATPIIDLQVSVASFEPVAAFKAPLEGVGYVFRADNTERTKRYFREPPGAARTHIHVPRAGSFSEQFPLLFRSTSVPTPPTLPSTAP